MLQSFKNFVTGLRILLSTVAIIVLLVKLVSCNRRSHVDIVENTYKSISRLSISETENQFTDYVRKYNRTYDENEYLKRKGYFKDSLKEISRLNALHGSSVFGVNKFSDLSPEERSSLFMKSAFQCVPGGTSHCPFSAGNEIWSDGSDNDDIGDIIPEKFDWREKGVVGPVEDQKRCRGCWSFSIVGVMETMWAIRGYRRPSLSVQQLLDCSSNTLKCDGGDIHAALNYMCFKDYGIVDKKDYPLLLINEQCKMPDSPCGRKIAKYENKCNMDEKLMLRKIALHGPLVAVVNSANWPYYNSGVIEMACENDPKLMVHVVQIVGYDLTARAPYYIVRNDWGEDFGENGYLRLAIGKNICGIANNVAYFTVK